MRIRAIEPLPFLELPYGNPGPRRRPGVERAALPVHRGVVHGLPEGVAAILATGDLQGRELSGRAPGRLVGEGLAEELAGLAAAGLLPPAERTVVLLAGDLYAVPDLGRRGGLGDVRGVWSAFAAAFGAVVGVAGNHDAFGAGDVAQARERYRRRGAGRLLDGDVADLGRGLRIGGASGIAGNPRKPNRRFPDDQLAVIDRALDQGPDVLVLHEGPAANGRRGSRELAEHLALRRELPLVVCGHCHWAEPLAELEGGGQVLNVDARAVVLTAA